MMKLSLMLMLGMFAGVFVTGARAEDAKGKKLRHVVIFKFKKDTSKADLEKITTTFAALPRQIDAIKDFEWGTDVSIENKAQGYTHCFLVTFADEAGREKYLPHPAHQEFVKVVGPHVEDVLVVDYWAK